MFGRPPRTRNERAQAPKMTEEQLKIELQQQADLKRKEQRVQQLQDKEEILKQLEGQGQEVGQFKERIHQEYQDVLPHQIKAEQDRATRIRLREEERVRRQNGLGSAYEQQKEMLPVQLEHKLHENLHKVHGDWLDQQPTIQNRVAQPSKVMQEFSYAPQGPHGQQQQKRQSIEVYQEREFQQRDVYSREAPHQQQQIYQEPKQHHHQQQQHQPQYRDNREFQNEFQQPPPVQPNNYISRDNPSQAPIDPQKEKQRKYREELDNQINQRNQQQYQQPSSQQSRRSDIQNGPDFQDRFTQQQQQRPPSSQQSGRSTNQSQQIKYREELDKQIQEKKLREQQFKGNQINYNNNHNNNNNRPNTIDVFDYQNMQELECNDPAQSPGYNQAPPQTAPQGQSPPSGFNSRKITKLPTGIDEAEKQRQQQQYAEELRKQMEERQRKKKEQEEEEKRKEQLEVLKFEQQQKQIEQKHKEEQQKLQQQQQAQKQVLEHQIANKQLAKKFNKVNGDDVIKTSAIQILQTSPSQQQLGQDKQQSQRTEMTSQFQDYPHNPTKQQQISYVPQNKSHQLMDQQQQQQYQQYQPQQQYQHNNYTDQQQQLHSPVYQQPQHNQQYFQHQTPINNVEQMAQYQQVLFNDQSAHNQQNMQIHKQYLQQLQQNRYEIEMTRQILEEKLRLQQLEMQNQLLVDQYSRKIYDINKEQLSFESEIKKLQDYLRGKQKRPLDPEVFTSALYFSAMGNKDQIRQVQLHQEQQSQIKQVPCKQPEQQVLPTHPAKVRHHNPITESMIDNDIELPGQSEYVHVHVDHLGKSFIPELQKLKSQIIEKSHIKSDIKSIPISNIIQTSPSILDSQFSHALPDVEQEYQWVEDEDEQMLDSQQVDNEQQLIEFESIDRQEEINSFENLQEEDKEAYDEQEVIGRQTNYNLNMLKTQEYIAMFKENIQSQSKQQDLKFPAKLLHQNTIKLHHSSRLSQPDSNNNIQISQEEESFYESKDEDIMHRGSAGKEVQMSQAQFEMDYTSVVIPEEDEDSQIKPMKQSIQSNKKQQYQKPKTIDVFSRPQSKQDNSRQQSKQSIVTSTNQSKMPHLQSHFPDQSRCTNLNPIQSETFIYPHKTELVKSRLDNLFQNCDQQHEILPKIENASNYHQTVQTIYDIQQSGKMEENSQWKQQLDLFAYEQSDC